MVAIQSFPPLVGADPHTLILGSMPGVRSLEAQQYYAHPSNAFWPIMAAFLGFDPDLNYSERIERLTAAGYMLWDVLQSCKRAGSLDGAIEVDGREPNPIDASLRQYPSITRVFFNGGMAEQCFMRTIWPKLDQSEQQRLNLVRLPSTSPAHARLNKEQKQSIWHAALAQRDSIR